MAAPVPRLSPGTESYPRRLAQVEMADSLRSPHEMCACPSAKAGTQAPHKEAWHCIQLIFVRASLSVRDWVPAFAGTNGRGQSRSKFTRNEFSRATRPLAVLLVCLLAGCGDLPRPFQGAPGATAMRLAQ